jgi:hypothetical protein
MNEVPEDDCVICSGCVERRRQRFSSDYIQIPIRGVCDQCQLEFWRGIMIVCDSQEEMDALREAIREDRRKGNPRPNGHELLKEIRARKATKH